MTSVTIEQNLESRQTYLRLKGVGRPLKNPQFGIGGDSNEMLSPAGWKNQDITNGARQFLEGDDLLLEMDSRLIKYIEPGRALEISVPELGFAQRIQPQPLLAFPSSKAPLPPGTKFIPFGESAALPGVSGPSGPPRLPDRALSDDDKTRAPHRQDGPPELPAWDPDESDDANRTRRIGDDDGERTEDVTSDGKTRQIDPDDVTVDAPDLEPEIDNEDHKPDEDEAKSKRKPQRPAFALLLAAAAAGVVIGFFGKYITDEYAPWSTVPGQGPGVSREMALVQTDAFGPLAEDLKRVPEKSPAGIAPDAVPGITPLTVNRGRSYFNYGAQKARENNKAEATYWYKRAVLMIEPDALTFLGDGYLNGDGVPRDVRTGYQLLRLAAALGSDRAKNYLIERLETGSIPNAPRTMGQVFRR